jgi:O-methyltransferase involved in polyketide biosynthesis
MSNANQLDVSSLSSLPPLPETMLWTLYNRASEAKRADAILKDKHAVAALDAIPFDWLGKFGVQADGSMGMRSKLFDDAIVPWMAAHPGGTVVELGCGLETQFHRIEDGRVQWLCVDTADAIAIRERVLPTSPRCKHIAHNAFELGWVDDVDASRGVFVTMQGLLMYANEADVRRLITGVVERFPGCELMFDAIPRWLSKKAKDGLKVTSNYTIPPMPWGLNRSDMDRVLRSWSPRVASVQLIPYGWFRGMRGFMMPALGRVPLLRDSVPTVVRVRAASS